MKILRAVYCWKNNGNNTEKVQKPVDLASNRTAREIAKQKREAVRLGTGETGHPGFRKIP